MNAGLNIEKFSQLFLEQKYQRWRVIFIDGGSKKRDISSIKKIIDIDKRFILVKQSEKFKGIFGAMNQGFKLAKNDEFLFFWGTDDFIYDKNILNIINMKIFENFKNIEKIDLFIFKSRYFNNKSKKFTRYSFFPNKSRISKLIKDYFSFLLFLDLPSTSINFIYPIVRRKLSQYKEKYRLSADLNYFLALSRIANVSFETVNKEIVIISDSGISSRRLFERLLMY